MMHTISALLICLSFASCSQKEADKNEPLENNSIQVANDIIDDKTGMPVRMKNNIQSPVRGIY